MTIDSISDRARASKSTKKAESPPDAVVEQLAELLPTDALEDALKGLSPEEITGPGGLLNRLAGRVIETAAFARFHIPAYTGLKRHLHAYLDYYNNHRAHTGRITAGRCPAELVYGAHKMEPR